MNLIRKMRNVLNSVQSKILRKVINISLTGGSPPKKLSYTQEMFLRWNAERLNIPLEESRERYINSWITLRGGHGGPRFKLLGALTDSLSQVFVNNSPNEIYELYQFHAQRHFLRMLSYRETVWDDDDPIIKQLENKNTVSIVDFGCGLAYSSRSLAKIIKESGRETKLTLADIPTIRKDFLIWLGNEIGIPVNFMDCTIDNPLPDLPRVDVCFATEFFEHVDNPIRYFEKIHSSMNKGGLLITNVADHKEEFMHITTNLAQLRQRIHELGYKEVRRNILFRKGIE